ncbi:MAG TPA: alkaline phosphatase family protein [Xanthobacteraceae bacterium]|nr:alkaline phosphatase family protein [Xanthobacteraceae bacterium]
MASPDREVPVEGTIGYSWTSPPGAAAQDWIGLCAVGAADPSCASVRYTDGAQSGHATTAAPATPGPYEFRYFLNNTFIRQATSTSVTVKAASVLIANAVRLSAGPEEISVKWSALPGDATAKSWIGLYKAGSPDDANNPSIKWAYTGGIAAGTWSTIAPGNPGVYEFRYFRDEGYDVRARSVTFTVAAPTDASVLEVNTASTSVASALAAAWTAPSENPTAWIGLFKVGAPDSAYLKWTYTRGLVSGTFTTNISAPGRYEFRYFSAKETRTSTSKPIAVHDRAAVWANSVVGQPGATIKASWKVPESEWSAGAQIGLYPVGGDDAQPLQTRPAVAASGTLPFTAPAVAGVYELRYFQDGSSKRRGTSTALRVGVLGPGVARSGIKNLVVIMQENHSFNSYFGRYCKAPTGSRPSCTAGPNCCEAGPASMPGAKAPTALTDGENLGYDPPHTLPCMMSAMHASPANVAGYHGVDFDSMTFKMDRYAGGGRCSNPRNFAYAPAESIRYHAWARSYAIADRFFQSLAGASSANDLYFARARFVILDNESSAEAVGAADDARKRVTFYDVNIADLLLRNGVSFGMFIEGYDAAVAAAPKPPANAPGCPKLPDPPAYPCVYDAGDVPFAFYASVKDDPGLFQDAAQFGRRVKERTLPAVSYVRSLGMRSEHPGESRIGDGTKFVQGVVDAVLRSDAYANQTLILVVPDESGGYFDHVAPPPRSFVDHLPYGPRTSFVAIGKPDRIIKAGTVSHVPMEAASILRFIEWNWFGGATGQLAARDAVVNNLGSLLVPALGVPP